MASSLAITASGLVTAVGFNAAASCAAIRAGIRNVQETNLWDRETGTYLAAGKVALPQWHVGLSKIADLAAPAIRECLVSARPVPLSQIPVLLCVPPADRPFRLPELDACILREVARRLGSSLHPSSRVIPRDHVGVVVALREAAALLADERVSCVIVAGVDSLLRHDLKNHYLSKRRLLTPKNSNGFSLGEAGSAVLVCRPATGPELRVVGTGLGHEASTIESDQPLRGEGLTQAIREAFREGNVGYVDLHYRISDLNGEHYKFKEMALAMMRLERQPKPKLFDLWHPIEYVGDVGAAIGPLVLAVALHAGFKGYGIGPTVLCTFGNDNGERAAAVLSYWPGETRGATH